ncbi:MAG TPA: hypothetical protein VFA07_01910 [Chthonomonadaceae bacterium]|nr:hypothetical protein [Chthonomonadaceae bacterium]
MGGLYYAIESVWSHQIDVVRKSLIARLIERNRFNNAVGDLVFLQVP